MDTERQFLNASEAAEFLRISQSYLRKLSSARTIPLRKIGRRAIYDAGELRDWADRKRIATVRETVGARR
jgi:hypothetical protein